MKKRRFIHNAILVTIIFFILRGLATAFSVYVSNRIGAEGMGLYQLVSSVYVLAITLATSAISTAVIRIVSEQLALNNTRSVKATFNRCFAISLILGTISACLMFFNAEYLGVSFLKDERTVLSLKLLSLSLPFLSSGAVIRGYFLGLNCPLKSASTDVCEQIIMMVVTIPILTVCLPKGIEYACCGLVVGGVISEIISFIYSYVLYRSHKLEIKGELKKGITKQIFSIAAPLAIGYYVRSILSSLENVLIPTGLRKYGASSKNALSQYGTIKGMVMPILFFPSALLNGFSSLLMPEVTAANAIHNEKRINYIIKKSFKATLLYSVLITGLLFCYSKDLGIALYKSAGVGEMLRILTPLIPLMYLDQIVDCILKGLNQQLSSMKYNTMDSFFRVIIIYLLVPIMGIKGYIIMLYAGTIFNAGLSINRLIVVGKVKLNIKDWFIIPLIVISISCIFTKLIFKCPVYISIIVASIIYVLLLRLIGIVTKGDVAFVRGVFYLKGKNK